MIREMIALRVKHAGNTPFARRCSMIAEMLRALKTATGWRRTNLLAAARTALLELKQIQRDGTYDNPLAHLRRDPQ